MAKDSVVADKIEWMRRFGHKGPEEFQGVGLNAKLIEFHAAMGLCNLNHIDAILERRKAICEAYDQSLFSSPRIDLRSLVCRDGATQNYAYYPVIFEYEGQLLDVITRLEARGIYPRRYFYPALDQVPEWSTEDLKCPISLNISSVILCLPLSDSLARNVVDQVIFEMIKSEELS